MSRKGLKRYAAKRDANEKPVLDTARKVGCLVLPLGEFDALLYQKSTGKHFMIDVKMPKGKPTKKQQALIAAGWPLHYIASPTQLLALLNISGDWPVRGDV